MMKLPGSLSSDEDSVQNFGQLYGSRIIDGWEGALHDKTYSLVLMLLESEVTKRTCSIHSTPPLRWRTASSYSSGLSGSYSGMEAQAPQSLSGSRKYTTVWDMIDSRAYAQIRCVKIGILGLRFRVDLCM